MSQSFDMKYNDEQLKVELHAYNAEWANDSDLRGAINAIISSASNWDTFSLVIETVKEP